MGKTESSPSARVKVDLPNHLCLPAFSDGYIRCFVTGASVRSAISSSLNFIVFFDHFRLFHFRLDKNGFLVLLARCWIGGNADRGETGEFFWIFALLSKFGRTCLRMDPISDGSVFWIEKILKLD